MKQKELDKVKENYNDNPSECPFCKSPKLNFGGSKADESGSTTKIRCDNCGKSWTEYWGITFIDFEEEDEE